MPVWEPSKTPGQFSAEETSWMNRHENGIFPKAHCDSYWILSLDFSIISLYGGVNSN